MSSGAPRLFDAVQDGVTHPSHSADSIGLNKKTDSPHFVPALPWLKWKVHLVWMWRCSRPQWLSPESTTFSAEHLIGSSYNRQKANEIFHNLSSCNTRSINELISGAILHKLQLVQPMIDDYIHYYCVYTAKLTLASQVLLNSCAQTLNIWDPEYQKNYFYRRWKSYPFGILLLPITSDTPLDIQDF